MSDGSWCVYLVLCENGSLYCGISNRPEARFAAHAAGKGAKYMRIHKPVSMRLVYIGVSREQAVRTEPLIKKLKAEQKRQLWAALDDFQTA
ncbi:MULTISPECIES: GIY-YIG nuclease family protein [unclassified Neisseria]|uniref:GIY-YIG nuclease family protein n=1 Tax=unclassified Neisseria TaxID=2623750 RepID=UPI002665836C|nr:MULTISPECIES: GIY-YIG nuclease family protein [unclassified Neisseria]MDO1510017.1 GIY-YIG nuclease family protein [Neisseria sp. MVDL19-042950]MDO1516217.1 GIY-YIG nuclease family protein [Neisseria sp. MVDL18-041461]MDO1563332.1 GIY-YIG nuclease family protein [Neisseria sp. MVDL20-010259]